MTDAAQQFATAASKAAALSVESLKKAGFAALVPIQLAACKAKDKANKLKVIRIFVFKFFVIIII
jgi:hypothetical protein